MTSVGARDDDGADSVRLYLNDIGQTQLLSAADEKRLARQIEAAEYVTALEHRWGEDHDGPPSGDEAKELVFQKESISAEHASSAHS